MFEHPRFLGMHKKSQECSSRIFGNTGGVKKVGMFSMEFKFPFLVGFPLENLGMSQGNHGKFGKDFRKSQEIQ